MYCTAFPTGFERDFYVCAINGTIARMMVDDTGAAAAGASNLHKVTPLLAQLNYIGCKAEQEDPVFTLHFELKLKTNNQKQHFKYFFLVSISDDTRSIVSISLVHNNSKRPLHCGTSEMCAFCNAEGLFGKERTFSSGYSEKMCSDENHCSVFNTWLREMALR